MSSLTALSMISAEGANQYMSCVDGCRGLQRFSTAGISFCCRVVLDLAVGAGFAFGILFAVTPGGFAGVFGGFRLEWHREIGMEDVL